VRELNGNEKYYAYDTATYTFIPYYQSNDKSYYYEQVPETAVY
jgi:hypothetical protein